MSTMGREVALLASVSSQFTEKTLKKILHRASGDVSRCETDWSVLGWSFEPAAAKGDNYLSVVHRVTIEGRIPSQKDLVRVRVIVKGMLGNEAQRRTFRSRDFFANEIYFYSQVLPVFEEFLRGKGQLGLLRVPRCLAHHSDGENDFLVLEDAKALGYNSCCGQRRDTWPLQDCLVVLRSLAQFHGISLALNHQRPAEFFSIARGLRETLFSEAHWNWYRRFYTLAIDVAKDAVSREFPGTSEAAKFLAMTAREFFELDKLVCSGHQDRPSSVISHGDSWAMNFMMRGRDAILFDFQLSRCSSPVLDVSYFIYTATDTQTRAQHFDELLRFYHRELTKVVASLGSDLETFYPQQDFMREAREQFAHGLRFALEALPAMMLDDSQAFDAGTIGGDLEPVDIADIWRLQPLERQPDRQRLADIVVHAIQHGFL